MIDSCGVFFANTTAAATQKATADLNLAIAVAERPGNGRKNCCTPYNRTGVPYVDLRSGVDEVPVVKPISQRPAISQAMAVQSIADAGFYSLVHEVLGAEGAPEAADDRRDETRQAFDAVQLIAPYQAGRLPQAGEFHHIRCQDLSPGGMSYLADAVPKCKQMLVLLGPAPFIFLTAEIAHHTPVVDGDRTRHLIGCRFTGRLKA